MNGQLTHDQRAHLRAEIDRVRREQQNVDVRACDYCGGTFIPSLANPHQRFCSNNHRRSAWLRTDKGREWNLANLRSRRSHGKVGTYNAGCRCELCRAVHAETNRAQRMKTAA